ncbi:Pycsar system effector family protein [Amycolatopsis sp. CA-126428]|uniref:Pycsar system effector family protein n=1 Tax=Amycolatopsis sp. CA-126428 TaxID=2073158 RepID=UPI001E5DC0C9|nr:Pycsar system effector family protein [Amycolatopsis sp. CA-126428]
MAANNQPTAPADGGEVPPHIKGAHEHARDELRRADTKAQILLSLVGAALAGVVALTTRAVSIPTAAALWLAAVPIFAAVLLLLSALRPRLTEDPIPGTWMDAALNGPAALLHADVTESADRIADDTARLGRIALCKYRRTATAVRLLKAGLCLAPVALLLAVTT